LAFRNGTTLGGFAAPLFLWLAGIGVVLSATRTAEREESRAAAVQAISRRGIEIFVLAFLFRLQAFVVSPGSSMIALFRVDILNVMGPAIIAGGLLWGAARWTAGLVFGFAAAAAAVAMATPLVRASANVDALPMLIQWSVRPAGEHTNFTLFPWVGFVFAGAACGVLIARARTIVDERRLHVWTGLAGAVLLAGGFYTSTLPAIYQQSSFWTSSPAYFAIRVGVMTMGLSLMYAVASAVRGPAWLKPLERFGRSSLFVYWIHVELVYGYASWMWRGRLPIWGMAAGYLALTVLMFRAIGWRDRWVARRRVARQPELEALPVQSLG
jgi:uncharacterized membrane protein